MFPEIRFKSIKVTSDPPQSLENRPIVIFVSTSLGAQEQTLCQNLASRLPLDLYNFGSWKEFRQKKLALGEGLVLLVVREEFGVLATTFAYNKPNIKVALISGNIVETLTKENTGKCDLVVCDCKEIFGYAKELIKEKQNLRSALLSARNGNGMGGSSNRSVQKQLKLEKSWEQRVFRAMGHSNYNQL